MGYRVVLLDHELDSEALFAAASECGVITIVDQLPGAAMRTLATKFRVQPSPDIIDKCVDRVAVKRFLEDLGVGVGPYVTVDSEEDIAAAADTKFSAILKLRNHGEGREGQVRVAAHPQLLAAWETLGRRSCVLEQRLTLGRELSIIVARSNNGQLASFPVAQQQYVHGKLEITYAPASLLGSGQSDAAEVASYIATELGIVGLLTIHMFVVGREVLVHELLPRPSALGLFTLDGCRTDQYEQQLRAVCGLALGESTMTVPGIAVVDLRGELWSAGEPEWNRVLTESGTHLHLYQLNGMAIEPAEGVVMGHLAACSGTAAGSTSVVRRVRKQLTSG